MAKGASRLRRTLAGLKLDVPAAPEMLDKFEGMAREGGFLHVVGTGGEKA